MDAWRTAVFQVVTADRQVLGTAFTVFGRRVLTCRHVLQNIARVQLNPGGQVPLFLYKLVYLFRSVDFGLIKVAEWAVHDTYDIACGRLAEGVPAVDTVPLETRIVVPSTAVTCAGFPASGAGTLVTFERHVAGRTLDGFLLDNAAAPGISGGPALVNGRAIGVVYADVVDEHVTLLVPLNEISSWIERTLGPIPDQPGKVDLGLTAFPIVGSVRYDIPVGVIRIFSRQYFDPNEARRFFNAAMLLRAEHNPEGYSEDMILVRPEEIVWGAAPEAFWERIFQISSRRSQRTVAAFFVAESAPHPDFLQPADRTIFEQFRSRLMH
jgi:hypothetical protein